MAGLKPIVGEIKAQDLNDNFSYINQKAEEAGVDPALEQQVQDIEDDLETHKADKANPHNVTKEQIGLRNVVNMRQVVAVGGDNMSRNDTTWWANSIPNDDKNYINSRILGLVCGNNGLFVFGDATTNARRFGIQVGHLYTSFAYALGTLELNPLGGRVRFNGGGILLSESGNPEGRIAAPVGSLYLRTDGSANNTLYVKESGTGNVGWVAK